MRTEYFERWKRTISLLHIIISLLSRTYEFMSGKMSKHPWGILFAVDLNAGSHTFSTKTCLGERGFYSVTPISVNPAITTPFFLYHNHLALAGNGQTSSDVDQKGECILRKTETPHQRNIVVDEKTQIHCGNMD